MSKYLLYGAGVSNIACAKLLAKHNIHFTFLVNENETTKEALRIYNNQIIYKENLDYEILNNYTIVRSPGIPHFDDVLKYCYEHNIKVISEIELALMFNNKGRYLVITGSNGKTTVVSMLYQILKLYSQNTILAGNIGVPLTEFIEQIDDHTNIILETSSFQLEDTYSLKPFIGTILNLTPNHLNHVESLDYYYQSKLKLIQNCETFILNIDDKNLISNPIRSNKVVTVSLLDKKADYHYHNGYINKNRVHHPFLIGRHNRYNVLFCYAICYLIKIPKDIIIQGIESFKGVEYRLQFLGLYKNIKIYNDAKSTTPESTKAAIDAFDDKTKISLLIGGQSKNLDFSILQKQNVSSFAYGEAKEEIKKYLPSTLIFNNLKEAFLASLNSNANVILLSPACASFDSLVSYMNGASILPI